LLDYEESGLDDRPNTFKPVHVINADEGRCDAFPFVPNLGTRLKQPFSTFSRPKIHPELCVTKFVMIHLFIFI